MKLLLKPIKAIVKMHKGHKIRGNKNLYRQHYLRCEYENGRGAGIEMWMKNHSKSIMKNIKVIE
jgi:hypothetical protein